MHNFRSRDFESWNVENFRRFNNKHIGLHVVCMKNNHWLVEHGFEKHLLHTDWVKEITCALTESPMFSVNKLIYSVYSLSRRKSTSYKFPKKKNLFPRSSLLLYSFKCNKIISNSNFQPEHTVFFQTKGQVQKKNTSVDLALAFKFFWVCSNLVYTHPGSCVRNIVPCLPLRPYRL